jgi:hypothetical protein
MMDRGRASAPFPPKYRGSGILLHVTSLPSRHGIGDLGPSARAWVNRLPDARAGALTLAKDNGDPTAPIPIARLKDGHTGDPLDHSGALSRRGFAGFLFL